jgi:hypothetical protein
MTGTVFAAVMTVAAALLAAWVDARVGDARPQTPGQKLMHVALSVAALNVALVVLRLVDGLPQQALTLAVLALFLPALVYALLAGFWLLRTLAEVSVGR